MNKPLYKHITASYSLLFALLCSLALLVPNRVSADGQVTLERAEFFSLTNHDKKEHDSGVYVRVTTKDGKTILARVDNADNKEEPGSEYKEGSEHPLKLRVLSRTSTKADCDGFKVTVKLKAKTEDKWEFNGRVVLYFTDGSTLALAKEGLVLDSKHPDIAAVDF